MFKIDVEELGNEKCAQDYFFIFGYVASIGIMMLSGFGLKDDAGVLRETVQMTIVEGIGVVLMYLIYRYVYLRLFVEARDYYFDLPSKKIIIAIFLIYPFICFCKTIFVGWNEYSSNIWFVDKDVSWKYIGEMIIQIPIVAIVGPIFEEICYRIFALSSARTKVGKTVAICSTILIFSVLHGSSWKYVLPDAVVFSVIYVITQNAAIPILLHIANNLSTIIVPTVGAIYTLLFKNAKFGIMGIPFWEIVVMFGCFLWGMIEIMNVIKSHLTSDAK